ncbi:MAG: lytic transglycosylase domain-containing protein [Syntrophobacteraceae bacterium]
MAPDSSLHRHYLGGSEAGFRRCFAKAASLTLLSLLIFTFHAQAMAASMEIPGVLAALSLPTNPLDRETSTSAALMPSHSDAIKGTPTVLWRNRIQIPIHEPLVTKYIRFYQGDGRKTFKAGMEKAQKYLPQMIEILESNGVPGEMVWIVYVESRFEKHASYRGAGGYWQMLASTARTLGLRVDRWVDERRDPIKSTKAAAKYLKTLHKQYDSWTLALAAYNAGCGPIACAVRKYRVMDGELYGRKLPARSAVYVSKVLAAMEIMREPEKHGFEYPNYCKPKDFDPVLIKSPLKLQEIAKWIDVPVSQLQELNPSLRQDAMPPDSGFALRLPPGLRERFDLAYEVHARR